MGLLKNRRGIIQAKEAAGLRYEETQLEEARRIRENQEKKRDQEKEAIVGQLNRAQGRNDLTSVFAELFGVAGSNNHKA